MQLRETLKLLFKLMLNSFWGKSGQQDNMYIVDVHEYMTLLTDKTVNVTYMQFVNENRVHGEYTKTRNLFVLLTESMWFLLLTP